MTPGSLIVPMLPLLDERALSSYHEAHRALADSVAVAGPAAAVFRGLQRRLLIESLANVQPIVAGVQFPPLFPAPRAFLTRAHLLRMRSAAAALEYVDSRLTMHRHGLIGGVLDQSTPLVLHALTEASRPSAKVSNAGMFRRTPIAFVEGLSPYRHPPGEQCDEMIGAAIDMASHAPAPAVARAAWLAFTLMSVHPFVDGNGRSARLLHLLLASTELPLRIDWGVVEQWSLDRTGYLDALRSGQMIGEFDPARLDARPFMTYAVETSTAGAHLARRRVEALTAEHHRLADRGYHDDHAVVTMAVEIHRVATIRELSDLGDLGDPGGGRTRLTEVVKELVASGVLTWVGRGAGRRTPDGPEPMGLAVTSRPSSSAGRSVGADEHHVGEQRA